MDLFADKNKSRASMNSKLLDFGVQLEKVTNQRLQTKILQDA